MKIQKVEPRDFAGAPHIRKLIQSISKHRTNNDSLNLIGTLTYLEDFYAP